MTASEEKKKPIIVKKVVSKPKQKTDSTSTKPDTSKKKVVSSDSVWTGSFFGGLWFTKKEEPKKIVKPKTKKEDKTVETKPSSEEHEAMTSDEFLEQASQIARRNAVVIRSTGTSSWSRSSRPAHTRRRSHSRPQAKQRQSLNKVVISRATPSKVKKDRKVAVSESLVKKENIEIDKNISVKEFSEKSGIPFTEILKYMISNKISWGINTALDFDTVSLIAMEFWVNVTLKQQTLDISQVSSGDLNVILEQDRMSEHKTPRAPIVTVMWHVDHGKTSLLDYLRSSSIADDESGGITQSIGASKITHEGQDITFIDTPWHELFTSLRSRGAKITNIAIIVIAVDDGVKPQTIESINHAKQAEVPIIIALTKIDKWNDKIEQIKADIGNYGLIPEERGGDVPLIGVSSKTWEGIDKLLEQILFQAEVLDLQYDPTRSAVGVVIDASKDAKQGVLTSMIVLSGTLQVGDIVVIHGHYGKVRKMITWHGKPIRTASGGDPVQILGITDVPQPGRIAEVVANEKEAHRRVAHILESEKIHDTPMSTLGSFLEQMQDEEWATLNIICKADGPSSLEAMKFALEGIELPKKVDYKIIHSGLGDVTTSDIELANISNAIILWFNINLPPVLAKKAESHNTTIKIFDIIYEMIDYIDEALKDLVEKEYREVERGTLEILGVFYRKDKTMIIWWKVLTGKVWNGMKLRVESENPDDIIFGEITSLQREQTSVKEVSEWHECGMKVKVSRPLSEGMLLTFYEMEEITDSE